MDMNEILASEKEADDIISAFLKEKCWRKIK
jgi:hypothetical protein